ncbi:MAG: DUF4391 domain-containing protein [Spirochaetes bacterium]|nr:DUF4391 domain-containing protein [Spirochaetota bacterium]
MLGLPRSTEVNRRVAKEKLYANGDLSPSIRAMMKDQIESITWQNKLADGTLGVAAGDVVKEIQVFEVALRQKALDKRILPTIAKAIPYKILFVASFGGEAQAWMEASGTFYCTEWFPLEGFALKFEGLNLDAVYESLARQIAGGRLDSEDDLAAAVDRDQRRQRLERDIALMEKKVLRELQFNRQVELNAELKQMKQELEELLHG